MSETGLSEGKKSREKTKSRVKNMKNEVNNEQAKG